MSEQDFFVLCGGAAPPFGFGTPVFIKRTSNALWAQSIDDEEIVTDFLDVDEAAARQVTLINFKREQRIGSPALFLYTDVTGHTQIGSRLELEPLLRNDFQLAGSPRIKRSIARFLKQPDWIAEAEREIDARRSRRVGTDTRMEPRMLIRGVFYDALSAALSGSDVMIRGCRGSGKTALLMWLAKILGERHGARIIGPLAAGPFQFDHLLPNFLPRPSLEAQRRAAAGRTFNQTELVEELRKFVDNHEASSRSYFFVDDVEIFNSDGDLLRVLAKVREKTRDRFSIISATGSIGREARSSYWDDDDTEEAKRSPIQLILEPLSPAEAAELIEAHARSAGQEGLIDRIGLKDHPGRHLPRSLLGALNAAAPNLRSTSPDFERIMIEYYDLAVDRGTQSDPRLTRTDALRSTFRILNVLADHVGTEQPVTVVLSDKGDLAAAKVLRDIGIIAIDDHGRVSLSHAWFRDWWRSKTRGEVAAVVKNNESQLGLFDDQT